jgi:Protein of unknown function (DUF2911)
MKQPARLLWVFIFITAFSCNDKPVTARDDKTPPQTNQDTPPVIQHSHNYATNIYATVDVSPMDMSYYPVEYYKLNMAKQATSPLMVRVLYSRPHLNGRKLFSGILKYGEAWRLGANESTEIQFFKEVSIQGKKVKPGRYIMYCIPNENTWTIVLNSNVDTWGLQPDPSGDIMRVEAQVAKVNHHTEYFTIVFSKSTKGADMLVAWDDYEIKLPLEFSAQ